MASHWSFVGESNEQGGALATTESHPLVNVLVLHTDWPALMYVRSGRGIVKVPLSSLMARLSFPSFDLFFHPVAIPMFLQISVVSILCALPCFGLW